MEKLIAVILMAGLSTRFEGPKNKQLCLLKGKPVFEYSIDTFSKSKDVQQLLVVVNKTNRDDIEKYINENNIKADVILGGITRQESVENALKFLKANKDDVIVIHDGARPLINDYIISEVAKAAKEYGAATAYIDSKDTIAIKDNNDCVDAFIERKNVARIQTPQAFLFGGLCDAHYAAKSNDATDDCSLMLQQKYRVKLVKGDEKFHKITTKEDITYLEEYLK